MIYGLIGLFAGIFVTALFFELRHRVAEFGRENAAMKIQVASLTDRVRDLEAASRLRMPHAAMEKVMNGMAALDALAREKKLETDFINNAQAWLTEALQTGTKQDAQK